MPIFSNQDLEKIKNAISPQTKQLKQFEVGIKANRKPKDLASPKLYIINFLVEDKIRSHRITPQIKFKISLKVINKGQTLAGETRVALYGRVVGDSLRQTDDASILIEKIDLGILLPGSSKDASFVVEGTKGTLIHFPYYTILCHDVVSDPFHLPLPSTISYPVGQIPQFRQLKTFTLNF